MPRNEGTQMIEYKPTNVKTAEAILHGVFWLVDGVLDLFRYGVFLLVAGVLRVTLKVKFIYQGES